MFDENNDFKRILKSKILKEYLECKDLLRRKMDNVPKQGYNQLELNATVPMHYTPTYNRYPSLILFHLNVLVNLDFDIILFSYFHF